MIPGFLTALCWLVSYDSLARLGIPQIVTLSSGVCEDASRRQQHLDHQTLLTNVVGIIQATGGYLDQRDEFSAFSYKNPRFPGLWDLHCGPAGSQAFGLQLASLALQHAGRTVWTFSVSNTCEPLQVSPPPISSYPIDSPRENPMCQAKVIYFNTVLITTQWSQTILLFHASLYHTFNIL